MSLFHNGANMSPTIAAFDFDRTLTQCDSLLPFLFHVHGRAKMMAVLIALIPTFLLFTLGRVSRQEVKEQLLMRTLKGKSLVDAEKAGEVFATGPLNALLKPSAMKRLEWHLSQGHRCILVSASLELYLKPWAQAHGFETVIASRLALTQEGLITGRLEGLNCWGEEKARRLKAYLCDEEVKELYAYGDSRGDHELLAMATHPHYRRL